MSVRLDCMWTDVAFMSFRFFCWDASRHFFCALQEVIRMEKEQHD